jgi:hypothetical protein
MRIITCFVGLLVLGGCSAVPEEGTGGAPPVEGKTAQSLDVAVSGREFRLAASPRLKLGSIVERKCDSGYDKVVGSLATFAAHTNTGAVLVVPNADAPQAEFTGTSAQHNQLARAFFEEAGIPPDEIADVSAMAGGRMAGPVGEERTVTDRMFVTVLHRRVGGFKVSESFAWAELDDAGQVQASGVYWPPISAGVVGKAEALRDKLSDEAARKAFHAKLPAALEARFGQVLIRHSWFGRRTGGFRAVGVYHVPPGAGTSAPSRSFDEIGAEIGLLPD